MKTEKQLEEENNKKIDQLFEKEKIKYGEIDQIFFKHDIDENGYLDERELMFAIKSYITIHPEKKASLDDLVTHIDIDGKNRITKEDFRKIMTAYTSNSSTLEDLIDIFKCFDKNLSGEIGPDELQHVFSKLGLNLSLEDAKALVLEADSDGDMFMDFEEFIRIMLAK